MSDAQLAHAVKAELGQWFGSDEVSGWQLMRVYRIPFAQPNQVCLTAAINTWSRNLAGVISFHISSI